MISKHIKSVTVVLVSTFVLATLARFLPQVKYVKAAPPISGSTIDNYLRGKNSPLEGYGSVFVDWGREYNVDPRLIVAIAGAESSFGTSNCQTWPATEIHNAWGYMYWPEGVRTCKPFASWEEGIETVTWQIGAGSYYFSAGRDTIEEIGHTYCGPNCNTWISNVTTFYTEMGGDVNNLRFVAADPYIKEQYITRDEIIRRAQIAVSHEPPFIYTSDVGDTGLFGWRRDCSGYASYAWKLTNKAYGTPESYGTSWLERVSYVIDKDELLPGDILNRSGTSGHVEIFDDWANFERTKCKIYDFTPTPDDIRHREIDYPNDYVPRRFDYVQETPLDTLTLDTGHFPDVPIDHPQYGYIEALYDLNAIDGFSDGLYRPDEPATRGQAAKIVILSLGEGRTYDDNQTVCGVAPSYDFYPFIRRMLELGISNCPSDGTWDPEDPLVRGGLAKYIVLARGENPSYSTCLAPYPDVDCEHPFYVYIRRLKELFEEKNENLGYTDGTFHPNEAITRGGIAKLVVIGLDQEAHIPTFYDVLSDNPFYPYVEGIAEREITKGCDSEPPRFCPDDALTRGGAAKFIIRGMGENPYYSDGVLPFPDVPTGYTFYRFIRRLKDLDITTGYSDGTYHPDESITRGAMAKFIVRALEKRGTVCRYDQDPGFSDVSTSHTFYSDIQCLKELGITSGFSDGTFRPDQDLKRAAAAKFVYLAFVERTPAMPQEASNSSNNNCGSGAPSYAAWDRYIVPSGDTDCLQLSVTSTAAKAVTGVQAQPDAYRITANDVGLNADLKIEVLASDGSTVLASTTGRGQDGDIQLSWQPPGYGNYYVRLINTRPFAEEGVYTYITAKPVQKVYLPLVLKNQGASLPAAPTDLQAILLDTTRILLMWTDNSNNETGFYIYDDSGYVATVGDDTTSYTVTGLTPYTRYCYYVIAFNDTGQSSQSNEDCATTLPISQPPNAPSNLRVSNTTQDSITLAWQDNSDNEGGFKIYRWNGTEFQYWASVGTNVTTFTDTSLDCNSGYAYEVSAYNSDGESEHTSWVEGFTDSCAEPPATPSNLQATALDSTRMELTWTDNSDNEDGFHIYDADYVATVGSNTTSYVITGLDPHAQYCYHIFAYNDAGTSAWTDWACDTTLFRYFDNFGNPSSGWPDDPSGGYSYQSGEYQIENSQANSVYGVVLPTVGAIDYTIEADMRLYSGTPIRYGLIFDWLNWDNYYVFSVNPTGQNWSLQKIDNGNWSTVADGDSSYVNSGNATNHLEVQRLDQMLQLMVNGNIVKLCTTCGGAFTGDLRVGLFAKSGNDVPVTARFDNLLIEEL